jgi:1A family penicillin-binding protein
MYRRDLLLLVLVLIFFFVVFPVLFVYGFASTKLWSKEQIVAQNATGVVLLDRNNTPYFSFYDGNIREYTPLSKVPQNFQEAVVAAEDKEFYEHPGFSVRGIIRSVILNLQEGEVAYGGSTITQQLIKTSVLTPERSFVRKYQEILLANELERRYDKNTILEMYLNTIYFGKGAIGIADAAKVYFGKEPEALTLSESAFLAGLLPSPSALASDNDSARRSYVLEQMRQVGYINDSEYNQALAQDLTFSDGEPVINNVAPHFALWVLEELKKKYGDEGIKTAGITVKTTIDLPLQEYAQQEVASQVQKLTRNNVSNGAAVVIDPDNGQVLAMVGSRGWYDEVNGKVNMTLIPRQPGSSFKPIVYSVALEKGLITPATVLTDRERAFQNGTYKPRNYDRTTRGNVLVRRALANSLNIPSVEIMDKVGVSEVLASAKRFGITTLRTESDYGLSLVLGTGEVPLIEMTQAYAMLAHGGQKNNPVGVIEIREKDGSVSFEHTPENEKVLDERVAFQISSILSDKRARSEEFGGSLDTRYTAAVKTGTTDDYRDAWTLGYTPEVAVGVWIGNNDNKTMDRVAGSLGAAPIWKNLITRVMEGQGNPEFIQPTGLVELTVCGHNGLISRNATSSAVKEYFVQGTQPTRNCNSSRVNTAVNPSTPPQATPTVQVTIIEQDFEQQVPLPQVQADEEDKRDSDDNPGRGGGREKDKDNEQNGESGSPIVN